MRVLGWRRFIGRTARSSSGKVATHYSYCDMIYTNLAVAELHGGNVLTGFPVRWHAPSLALIEPLEWKACPSFSLEPRSRCVLKRVALLPLRNRCLCF